MKPKNSQLPLPTGNISQCLNQMTSDAIEIERRLLGAPPSLTSENEPRLFKIITEIKTKLEEAKEAWPD